MMLVGKFLIHFLLCTAIIASLHSYLRRFIESRRHLSFTDPLTARQHTAFLCAITLALVIEATFILWDLEIIRLTLKNPFS